MSSLPQFAGSVEPDAGLYDGIAAALSRDGYIVLPTALPPQLIDALFMHLKSLHGDHFHRAGIGKQTDHQLNKFVRSDAITWLNGSHPASRDYLDWMERLRLALNRRLFLGLFDFECHYAWYRRGTFYRKHLDAFRGRTNRVISTVLYLNPNWEPQDAGELLLYSPRDENRVLERIAPQYGKLVLFLSEDFPHEVLPVNRSRYSVAGWFRVNNSLGPVIDPPR